MYSHPFSFLLSFSEAYPFLSSSILVLIPYSILTGLFLPFVFSLWDRSGFSALFFSPSTCGVVQVIPIPTPELLIFHFIPVERCDVFCVQTMGSYIKAKIQNCLVWLNINKYCGGYIVYLFISVSPSLFQCFILIFSGWIWQKKLSPHYAMLVLKFNHCRS